MSKAIDTEPRQDVQIRRFARKSAVVVSKLTNYANQISVSTNWKLPQSQRVQTECLPSNSACHSITNEDKLYEKQNSTSQRAHNNVVIKIGT